MPRCLVRLFTHNLDGQITLIKPLGSGEKYAVRNTVCSLEFLEYYSSSLMDMVFRLWRCLLNGWSLRWLDRDSYLSAILVPHLDFDDESNFILARDVSK